MGKFLTLLDVEQIEDAGEQGRGLWRLTSPLIYEAEPGIQYTVPKGFITDFASVPRIPLVFDYLGDRGNLAGTLHDFFYSHPAQLTRAMADQLLKEALVAQGVSPFKAQLFYLAVRLFGAKFYNT